MTNLSFLVVLPCFAASDALVTPPAAHCDTQPVQPLDADQTPRPDKQCQPPLPDAMYAPLAEFLMLSLKTNHPAVLSLRGMDDRSNHTVVQMYTQHSTSTAATAAPWASAEDGLVSYDEPHEPPPITSLYWDLLMRTVAALINLGHEVMASLSCNNVKLGVVQVLKTFALFASLLCFTHVSLRLILVPLCIISDALKFVACLLVVAGAVGLYGARKLWRSIVNASGFVSTSKIIILVLVMLPFCGAVRVHGSGAGPQATRADTRAQPARRRLGEAHPIGERTTGGRRTPICSGTRL